MDHHQKEMSKQGHHGVFNKNDKKSNDEGYGRTRQQVRRSVMVMENERGGDINDMADNFIKKFRNQLRIEREESFKRFQEMISRGV
ncbi:hypothetical protein Tsubulata_006114 [Turnera subulata]|uniref:DUF761 domain-containing protein n=1 Tax=Turnera subulata TaxID=218843 RepID=A0A9Q0JF81_9ROSI|nr:hypothetical protein Tsubulata_006114 [Turnera subulata]